MSELQHQISLLIARMQHGEECPGWARVRILDTTRPDVRWKPEIRGWQLTRESLVSSEDYEPHFQTLLQAGHSWINLSLYGVHDGTLVVGVELSGEPSRVPPGKTAINFSGPAIRREQTDWQLRLELVPAGSKW